MKRAAGSNDANATDDDDHKLEGKRSKGGDARPEQDDAESNHNNSQPQESTLAAGISPQEMTTGESAVAAAGGPVGGESSELNGGGETAQQPSPAGGGEAEEEAKSSIRDSHVHSARSATADDLAAGGGESSNKQAAAPHTFDNMEDIDILEYSRDHSGSLTFPEKLMLMLLHIEKFHREMPDQAPVGWVNHTTAFAVHNTDRLCNDWIPLFFRPCKFSSFRRKLFRWEFRLGAIVDETDMNLIPAASQEIVFCNENFKRDQKHLLSHMKSVTAEKTAEKEELELRMSLGNDMPSDERHQKQQEDPGRGSRLQKQQQQNRLVQGPPLQGTAVGPGYSGSLLPYSSMLVPPPHGVDSIHFRQQTLQHGPAAASYLQQQEQEPTTTTQSAGMTTIPANDDAMTRQVLAVAATKATAAGHQPRQQKQMAALGGQQPSLATAQYQQQHNPYYQPQLHEGGRASAENHDVADNDVLWHSRQTTTLPQQHASHQEQLQNLLAWQSRQMSQLRGAGGGSGEALPPINNGGGGSGGPDLMTNPHRTPQEERRIRQQLLLGASVPQQQHSAPFESGGRSGSHFGLPGGNPW